jgi:hypothetical protein
MSSQHDTNEELEHADPIAFREKHANMVMKLKERTRHATYSSVVGGMDQKCKSSVETIFCNCGQRPSWNQHTQVMCPRRCVLQSAF